MLVLRGGEIFANGIHLNVIEAAPSPEIEAWHNIQAIDDVCREIITCTGQLVVASVGGNAGAGGVMLALGADRVLARDGVVLNPHYRTMGLYGSEYWTYVLPRRVGAHRAESLAGRCEPVDAQEAVRIGLVDDALAGPPAAFEEAVLEYATRLATRADLLEPAGAQARRPGRRRARRPLESYRAEELALMHLDIFDDRRGFAAARHAFVHKRTRSAGHRPPSGLEPAAHPGTGRGVSPGHGSTVFTCPPAPRTRRPPLRRSLRRVLNGHPTPVQGRSLGATGGGRPYARPRGRPAATGSRGGCRGSR